MALAPSIDNVLPTLRWLLVINLFQPRPECPHLPSAPGPCRRCSATAGMRRIAPRRHGYISSNVRRTEGEAHPRP